MASLTSPPPGAANAADAMESLFARVEATELAQRALQQLQQQMQGLRVENDLLRERLRSMAPVASFQDSLTKPPAIVIENALQDNAAAALEEEKPDDYISTPTEDGGTPKQGPSSYSVTTAGMSKKAVRAAMQESHGAWQSVLSNVDEHPSTSHLGPDPSKMRKGARKAILEGYDVKELYHPEGVCRKIVASAAFEYTASGVVLANALYIAIDVDLNAKEALFDKDMFYVVSEFFFFAYFIIEWLLRFGAFARKRDGLKDRWFIFDSAMVVFSFIDMAPPIIAASSGDESSSSGGKTSMLRLVRLAKLTKMARMARLLRKWPELTILIKGLFISARSVMSTMFLMLVIVVLFSVAFRQLTFGTEVGEENFNSVTHGMTTLLLGAAFPDVGDIIIALGDENLLYGFLGFVYFFTASLTLMNMLIGVLCEVVSVVSSVERDAMQVTFVKHSIMGALDEAGIKFSKTEVITKDVFHDLLMKPAAAKAIRAAGVDLVGLVDFSDYIFGGEFKAKGIDGAGLTLEQLIELVLELGGTNGATVKDIIDSRKIMVQKLESIDETLEEHLSNITTTMTLMMGSSRFGSDVKDGQSATTLLAKSQGEDSNNGKGQVHDVSSLEACRSPETRLWTL